MTGRVVHFEVPFSDGDRARNFYQQIFGWQLKAKSLLPLHDPSLRGAAEYG